MAENVAEPGLEPKPSNCRPELASCPGGDGVGHGPRGTATAQLQTRHLRQAPPGPPLHRPRKRRTLWGTRRPRDNGGGGGGGVGVGAGI